MRRLLVILFYTIVYYTSSSSIVENGRCLMIDDDDERFVVKKKKQDSYSFVNFTDQICVSAGVNATYIIQTAFMNNIRAVVIHVAGPADGLNDK